MLISFLILSRDHLLSCTLTLALNDNYSEVTRKGLLCLASAIHS